MAKTVMEDALEIKSSHEIVEHDSETASATNPHCRALLLYIQLEDDCCFVSDKHTVTRIKNIKHCCS